MHVRLRLYLALIAQCLRLLFEQTLAVMVSADKSIVYCVDVSNVSVWCVESVYFACLISVRRTSIYIHVHVHIHVKWTHVTYEADVHVKRFSPMLLSDSVYVTVHA